MQKTPYMLVVGQSEMDSDSVAVRRHGAGDQGVEKVESFIALLQAEIDAAFGRTADEA